MVKVGNSTLSDGRLFLWNITKLRVVFAHASHPDNFLARAKELTRVRGARLEVRTCSVFKVLQAEVQRQTDKYKNSLEGKEEERRCE